jgi:hypothetical protein
MSRNWYIHLKYKTKIFTCRILYNFPDPDIPIVFPSQENFGPDVPVHSSSTSQVSGSTCGRSPLVTHVLKKGDLPWLALESFEGEKYCVSYLSKISMAYRYIKCS